MRLVYPDSVGFGKRFREMTAPRLARMSLAVALPLLVFSCGSDQIKSPDPDGDDHVTPQPPAIQLYSGNTQEAVVTTELPAPLVVRVVDSRQQPVAGIEVNWEVVSGGGSVDPTVSTTGSNGMASTTWTLGSSKGLQEVKAQADELLNAATFRAFALAAPPASLEFIETDVDSAVVSMPFRVAVMVHDSFGNPASDVEVQFSVEAGDGWLRLNRNTAKTNAEGVAGFNAWTLGYAPGTENILRARVGNLVDDGLVVGLAPDPAETYFGRNDYIEYLPGELPLIITAPHGGYERPDEIPDRTWGTFAHDTQTQELSRAMVGAFMDRYDGKRPHVIICHLRRIKLDANRAIGEAAQDNPYAEQAWHEFHAFTETAKQVVTDEFGEGFYIDLHGHGHDIQRLELGYLLNTSDLTRSDASLDQATYINKSSVRALAASTPASFPELIRGATSLGTLYENAGIPSVPSSQQPHPDGQPFFSGGHNTRVHGSRDGGTISGVQIEANWTGVRNTADNRRNFSEVTALIMDDFFEAHFGARLSVLVAGSTVTGSW